MSAFLGVRSVWAHGGPSTDGSLFESLTQTWTWAPLLTLNLLILSLVYGVGFMRMRRHRKGPERVSAPHAVAFYLGVLVLVLALMSPIDALSEVLGWVHMIQHNLIMMVAAPLMIFGAPGYVALWAVPRKSWAKISRHPGLLSRFLKVSRFSRPIAIWVAYFLTLWTLHLPVLYEAALANGTLHDLQHIAFFVSSLLLWRIALDPYFRRTLQPGVAILYLFITSMHAMILGVLMALSPRVWYASYESTAPQYGFTALEDQQLAGYIMWMPAGISFLVVSMLLLRSLITSTQKEGPGHVAE